MHILFVFLLLSPSPPSLRRGAKAPRQIFISLARCTTVQAWAKCPPQGKTQQVCKKRSPGKDLGERTEETIWGSHSLCPFMPSFLLLSFSRVGDMERGGGGAHIRRKGREERRRKVYTYSKFNLARAWGYGWGGRRGRGRNAALRGEEKESLSLWDDDGKKEGRRISFEILPHISAPLKPLLQMLAWVDTGNSTKFQSQTIVKQPVFW